MSSRSQVLILLVIIIPLSHKGDTRSVEWLIGKLPSRENQFKPITGKYASDAADKYYNNPKYVLGHKIVFICVAQGTPLPQITWFKEGVEIFAHRYMQVHEWKYGDTLKSKMEIDPASQADIGIYECNANNKYAVDSRAFRTTYIAEYN